MDPEERETLGSVIEAVDSLLAERGDDFRAWDAAGEMPAEFVEELRQFGLFEGTNEVLRLFVALTALNDVGQQLKEMASSLKGIFDHPIKGFGVLSKSSAWGRDATSTSERLLLPCGSPVAQLVRLLA